MEGKLEPFGLHLMVDAYNCDSKVLNDGVMLYDFLEQCVKRLDMRFLTTPYIVRADGNDIKDPGGWSGYVMIQESHISFHTFVKRGFVSIDAYSCRQYDTKIILDYIKEFFKTQDLEINTQVRGTRYPDHNIYE